MLRRLYGQTCRFSMPVILSDTNQSCCTNVGDNGNPADSPGTPLEYKLIGGGVPSGIKTNVEGLCCPPTFPATNGSETNDIFETRAVILPVRRILREKCETKQLLTPFRREKLTFITVPSGMGDASSF